LQWATEPVNGPTGNGIELDRSVQIVRQSESADLAAFFGQRVGISAEWRSSLGRHQNAKYWKPGSLYYGKTKRGEYISEKDAVQKGYPPANGTGE
jgi:hypothetical protein